MVIVIVSIILSFATLAVTSGSPKERLQTEAQRLASILQIALDESLLQAAEYGVVFAEDGYQFMVMQDYQWLPVNQDRVLKQRKLPDDMELELEVEQLGIDLDSITKIGEVDKIGDVEKFESESEAERAAKPQVYLLSSGEMLPSFRVRFFIPGLDPSYTVKGTDDGTLSVEFQPS